ncbi:cation:proton antiporter regulatory subunit [Cohnella silvisoli]|uniref:TrkA C-terminal domain-containing protein n=1 Tax=Cohnella silvisoli TaxID=2873699 RepID=A0ABV1KTN0_9BACL|nr:TrkA C-terminal domain-containing protein [Cohnella silvisoli]MCD9022883.1 potassium transporter TrkA [Cohnella silvisoli]
MKIRTSDLPGVGKRISMTTANQNQIVLIVHHTGLRELYFMDDEDEEECKVGFSLSADETRELGAQLLGATYQPMDLDQMKMFKNKIMIEWVEVKAESRLAGKTIRESKIRTKTGASIIGIVRGPDVIAVPEVDLVLNVGDTLMLLGRSDQIEKLSFVCKGEEGY